MSLLRIEAATSTAETSGVVAARKKEEWKSGVRWSVGKERGEGPLVIVCVGQKLGVNCFLSGRELGWFAGPYWAGSFALFFFLPETFFLFYFYNLF